MIDHFNFSFVEYLRGFETFAVTSFNVTDSHAHIFEWQRYGLKLHIPEGAVPAHCKKYLVKMTISAWLLQFQGSLNTWVV